METEPAPYADRRHEAARIGDRSEPPIGQVREARERDARYRVAAREVSSRGVEEVLAPPVGRGNQGI